MTGMQTVIELRRMGVKPSAVFVELVREIGKFDAEKYSFCEQSGIVNVNIAAAESLAAIDFRPLTGLTVHLYDHADDAARQSRVSKLLAAVEPRLLVVPKAKEGGHTVHRRFAGDPPTVDRIEL